MAVAFVRIVSNILEEEAKPVIERWHELFSERTGTPPDILSAEVEKARSEILSNPDSYGWENNGRIVARATADPYVFNTAVYQILASKLRGYYALPEPDKTGDFLSEIFFACYPLAATVFRPGAKKFLDWLAANFEVVIVTNSKTDAVEKKLAKLGQYPGVRVIGNAKKYVLGESGTIPESMQVEGLRRPVYLRRMDYKAILDGFDPQETAVVGDIFELDIALPEYLGFRVVQVDAPNVPEYEIAHHNGRQRNFFARSYEEALDFLSC